MSESYLAINNSEKDLLQRLLLEPVIVGSMTVKEYEALNSLRRKFHLPELEDVDDRFIMKYCQCLKGCEG